MLSGKALSASLTAGAEAVYVEDVFSTYLYTGNGSTQTITNNIDLSGEGGLVWNKARSSAVRHVLSDTARGTGKNLYTNDTSGEVTSATSLTSFNSDGYSLGSNSFWNGSGTTYASWTFRKAEKFFDVVTYTGNGVAGKTVSHNLGSVPGCIIIKRTDASGTDWAVWHRSQSTSGARLNNTAAFDALWYSEYFGSTQPTSTVFTIGDNGTVNGNGLSYVAYLFAHDAGGFGDAGDQSVIKCGSYSGTGAAGNSITLDWEPQWLLIKNASATYNWTLLDNMRGLTVADPARSLFANTTAAESDFGTAGASVTPTATGFQVDSTGAAINASGNTYIYIAIRRGPMRTPTSATTVFTPVVRTGTNGTTSYTGLSFSPDLAIGKARANTYSPAPTWTTKLIGTNAQLGSNSSNGETAATDAITGWLNTGYDLGADNSLGNYNLSTTANNYVSWNFGRAPGFFDVVCYTGTGTNTTITHNLGVAPELMIIKRRSGSVNWAVYVQSLGNTKYLVLNANDAVATGTTYWNSTSPTSSVFSLGTSSVPNQVSQTYVAWLFATLAGVSKVGTYTGTGTTLQVDCGFTSGSRFVMIKRTDQSGSWYVWDSARGIVSGNDPYLLMDLENAEVTNTDYVDTYSAGFEISSTAPAAINANGGTFIYLAIA